MTIHHGSNNDSDVATVFRKDDPLAHATTYLVTNLRSGPYASTHCFPGPFTTPAAHRGIDRHNLVTSRR